MNRTVLANDLACPMTPEVVRVVDVHRENQDTFTIALAPPRRDGRFAFRPGQFNMLYQFAVGEVPISMSGDPGKNNAIVHTIRAVGSVTTQLEKLHPGDALGVRGPFGSSWPVEEARGKDVVLVTGGIGLAPLRPVIYYILDHRDDFGRIVFLHGSRSPDDLIFRDELFKWLHRDDMEVLLTVDKPLPGWTGSVGLVTNLFQAYELDAENTIGMICGPEIMMRFTLLEFQKKGLKDEQLFVSLERNMQCAIGFCGHCQFGPEFVCMDGPVFRYDRIKHFFHIREA